MMTTDPGIRERLAAAAARVRASGGLGKSDSLIRLFDFLLERSLADRVPKEIEIAQEVFGKTTDFDGMVDASVRVYVHRLRRKLADHYATAADNPDHITVPLGEYRMVLVSPEGGDDAAPPVPVAATRPDWRIGRLWLALLVLALGNGLAWTYYIARQSADAGPTPGMLWQPIMENRRPTLLIMGDYYIFGDAPDGNVVSRLVRDFSINSAADLDNHLLAHPDKVGRYLDVNLHYLPVGGGLALRSLLPVVNAAARPSRIRPVVDTMSNVRPEIFKAANIVYVGFFSGLGPLQDALFRASGFRIGNNFDELVDKASGRRFTSDWGVVADGKVPRRDFGYIASVRGPAGNRILIIAGTRDPAVLQMAEVAADAQQIDAIVSKNGGDAFEALFEVRTLGNLNLGSSLVLARPLRAGSIW
ncbi:hypothetical protein [Novosphingobium sp.]|uniref:helix-turn-helix domain-containing protein n=1 Tax=Novosphingobium sp. TaxID=1874826 RepID=UPI003340E8BC